MTGHQLARRLLELPDERVVIDGIGYGVKPGETLVLTTTPYMGEQEAKRVVVLELEKE